MLVTKIDLIQPGKGNAVIQVEMKDLRTGNKTQNRWRTQENVERARMDELEMQYLFSEGENHTFMDNESFEQFVITSEQIGDPHVFLQEGMICTVLVHEGSPISAELPKTVTMDLVEADPVVKGQTQSSSYKPGVLENGVRVMVPPHIQSGTRIVVNTQDRSYVERAKD